MRENELKILEKVLNKANEYFTEWCDFNDTYVCSQAEIDEIEDEEEQELAQEVYKYDKLLNKAINIIEKYKGGIKQ